MNGVCVRWRGWIDLERLDGVGCLEYDEERAAEEDALLREQLERYNQRLRDFEEKQRAYRSGAAQPPHLNHYHHEHHGHHHHHGHHSRHVSGAAAAGATAASIESHLPHRQDAEMEVRLRAYWDPCKPPLPPDHHPRWLYCIVFMGINPPETQTSRTLNERRCLMSIFFNIYTIYVYISYIYKRRDDESARLTRSDNAGNAPMENHANQRPRPQRVTWIRVPVEKARA